MGDFTADCIYVIDLNYRAFSVNGQIHFNLDNCCSREPDIT